MFSLLRCLTAVSTRCKVAANSAFVAGPNTAHYAGNWLDAGDAALTGAPDLMTDAKDALMESIHEHGILLDQGEMGAHQNV